jgi:RNA polymerase sigma-70 factor (ECF subfamily)
VGSDRDRYAHTTLDPDSRRWVQRLDPGHPGHEQAVGRLRELLVRVARHELGRRRGRLGSVSGPEFDDLVNQAADDAVVTILGKLDAFEGRSRFTTWSYKFVVFEISAKVARHAWQHHPPSSGSPLLEHAADRFSSRPADTLEQREQLRILSEALGELTERQQRVFVAVALNDVPIDELALELGANRNAIYKNLFDARRRLRTRLAEAGHPVAGGPVSTIS